MDPRRYNGAMMLGLNGIVVKSHGGTDALGFANAIGVAVDLVAHDFIERTRRDLVELAGAASQAPDTPRDAVSPLAERSAVQGSPTVGEEIPGGKDPGAKKAAV